MTGFTPQGAMLAVSNTAEIQFVFAGGGALRPGLERFCAAHDLKAAAFLPYGSNESFAENLRASHIGLVTLRDGCEGTVVPSKVYSLLCAGRPVLFIGPAAATPARLIAQHRCGWHFENGDSRGVAELLQKLSNEPEAVIEAGANARRAFEEHFTKAAGTQRILEVLAANPC
ncbi:MAG: glycosyltransferase family 4 protein [Acidobacteria bacterium]|nr:glycosyltransferase family 4 protein [Acidobacteriota bacterium]